MKNKGKHIKLNDSLTISEMRDGFWIYDKEYSQNIALRAKTEHEAFVMAIEFYKKRFFISSKELAKIQSKVNEFVVNFKDDSD